MALLGKKTRKTVAPNIVTKPSSVPISAKYLTITDGYSTAHFKRLGYKNCPNIEHQSRAPHKEFRSNQNIIDMNRWDFVMEMYDIISKMEKRQRTKLNIFNALISLVELCDEEEVFSFFSEVAIKLFVNHLKARYSKGVKGKTLQGIQTSIKAIIIELNEPKKNELIELFYPFPNDTNPIKPYTDQEVKTLVQNLYKIVSTYRKHLLESSIPKKFPLYDESKLISSKVPDNYTRTSWNKKISTRNNSDTWKQDLVRAGYYLMCFFTGINNKQLLELKISDITTNQFIESSRGTYILSTIKNRQ